MLRAVAEAVAEMCQLRGKSQWRAKRRLPIAGGMVDFC
jgi:hypothetical protein